MRNQKKHYFKPVFKTHRVLVEQCIAASSVTVSAVGGENPYQPQIEDWDVAGEGHQFTEL